MHDPRQGVRISERDLRALRFIGEGYEVAQYQLHAAVFPNVSAVVVSHFVTRAVRNGWIAVERWNRVGINRLRLTPRGRDVAEQSGADASSLFVPRRATAAKDVPHTLWINDLRVILKQAIPPFDLILAAWQLQRRMPQALKAVPDVLAVRKSREGRQAHVFAAEVDLGGEGLVGTFLPKLRKLSQLVQEWSEGTDSTILVLTSGARRAATISALAQSEQIGLVAAALPPTCGLEGMHAAAKLLAAVLEHSANSN